jgi:uncharacterized protein YegL
MHGEPIQAVQTGLEALAASLRSDPQALETVWLSIVTFDEAAREVAPLTEIVAFTPPRLEARGATALGAGLATVARAIARDVRKTTAEQKGDWKPIVFIMTDGAPTDGWRKGLEAFRAAKLGLVVACAAGAGARTDVLKEITENVVALETADSASLAAFFKWVSASIAVSSQRIDLRKTESTGLDELPPPPGEIRVVL